MTHMIKINYINASCKSNISHNRIFIKYSIHCKTKINVIHNKLIIILISDQSRGQDNMNKSIIKAVTKLKTKLTQQ